MNQLTSAQVAGSCQTDFTYDGKMRLRMRSDYSWNGSTWVFTGATKYVYDGMLVVQERDYNNNPTVTYTRGTDLSGTIQGAGGIGGLLSRSHGYTAGSWTTHNFYHADGNGNITYLINSSQTLAASYKYNLFGGTISSSGTLATANTYRFSSKEYHSNPGLYYYGYRFYDPNLQRWLNRDPIDIKGGKNLYAMVRNNTTCLFDPFGLKACGSKEDGSVSEYIVPDYPFGHNFSEACQNHDNCYGDCYNGKSKKDCDEAFWSDMYDVCEKMGNPIVEPRCKEIADIYYKAVRNFGKQAWTHARNKCDCG